MTWRRLILQSLERSVFLCGSIKIAMLDLSKKGIPSLVAMGGTLSTDSTIRCQVVGSCDGTMLEVSHNN